MAVRKAELELDDLSGGPGAVNTNPMSPGPQELQEPSGQAELALLGTGAQGKSPVGLPPDTAKSNCHASQTPAALLGHFPCMSA